MTADKVVDASALAAISFLEPAWTDVWARVQNCDLHAPLLLRYEMANVCLKKIRAFPSRRSAFLARYRGSFAIPLRLHDIDHSVIVELADRHKLTAYDASYLWLAKQLNCELVTLDGELAAAALAI